MGGKSTDSLESLSVVGVDIGKDTFHLVGFDDNGSLVVRRKIKRLALEQTFEKLPKLDNVAVTKSPLCDLV